MDEISSKSGQQIVSSIPMPEFERYVLPLEVPQFPERPQKCVIIGASAGRWKRREHADPTHAIWLLGTKIQWPDCNRATDQLDELAPLHSIALLESGASKISLSYTLR